MKKTAERKERKEREDNTSLDPRDKERDVKNNPRRGNKNEKIGGSSKKMDGRKEQSGRRSGGKAASNSAGHSMWNIDDYNHGPSLVNPQLDVFKSFDEYANYIAPTGVSISPRPTHAYRVDVQLRLGPAKERQDVAIANIKSMSRNSNTPWNLYRDIDDANYQHACHYVTLLCCYAKTIIKLAELTSYSDSNYAQSLAHALTDMYPDKESWNQDVVLNLKRLSDAYDYFVNTFVVTQCLNVDSYSNHIRSLFDNLFLDEALLDEDVPVMVNRPKIAAYLSPSFTRESTSSPITVTPGEISIFPRALTTEETNAGYTTFMGLLISEMIRVKTNWGRLYFTVSQQRNIRFGSATNVEIVAGASELAPVLIAYNPVQKQQLKNAILPPSYVVVNNAGSYSTVAISPAVESMQFAYENILTDDNYFTATIESTKGVTDVYIPTRWDPSGFVAYRGTAGEELNPLGEVVPLTLDYTKNGTSAQLCEFVLVPLIQRRSTTKVSVQFTGSPFIVTQVTPVPVNLVGDAGATLPVQSRSILTDGNNTLLDTIAFNSFHMTWNEAMPMQEFVMLDQATFKVTPLIFAPYDKMTSIARYNLENLHRNITASLWSSHIVEPLVTEYIAEKVHAN